MSVEKRVSLWLKKQASFLLLLTVTLFVSAGSLGWTMGWVQMGLYVFIVAFQAVVLIPRSPELIAERSGYQKGTKVWDLVIAGLAAALLPMVSWVVAGLDYRHSWTSEFPLGVRLAAIAIWLGGYFITVWAMSANPFFSATVRIQDERGQSVSTGGPYRFVRHPGYVGAILFQIMTPFLLNSWWALIPSALSVVLYVVRTALEDSLLRAELEGYAAYSEAVRWRLVPGIW